MSERRKQIVLGWAAPLALAALLGAWGGCVTAPEEQGGALHRHNWWNYYARGVYFLKHARVEEAQADFQRCLGLLSGAKFGNARDMWRARTYGLHFVEGYFPNRELGVCLFERGDAEQAVRFLETSLRQEPSGRAKHYLNLARQKRLAAAGAAAPEVRVDGEPGPLLTRERACEVRGTASGAGQIRRLRVAGEAQFIELAEPARAFARRVPLAAGTNRLEVVAEDLLGQRAARALVRVADWQPPRVTVRRVTPQGREWLVEGVCRDEYGVAALTLDGRPLPGGGAAEVPVAVRVGADGAALEAVDRAGNRLAFRLEPQALLQAALAAPAPPARAEADTALARMEAWSLRCLRGGGGLFRAADSAPAASGDRLRPALSLRGCQAFSRVFAEDFFVDGTAADGGGLASVCINGENLLAAEDAGTVRTYFARRLPLDEGTNRFEVVATDRSGNRTSLPLTVVRSRPEFLDERYRLSVGVPPLTPAEAGPVGVRVKRSMETELTREPVRFRLLERDEGWDFVLREQGLSVSDLADPAAALRIGKLVPAEMLLMGKIFNEAKGVTIYLKAVETANGEVVFASDVYTPDAEEGLPEAVEGLVLKVEQGFPLVSGEVLRREGARVTLSVGREAGVTETSRFLVVEAGAAAGAAGGRVCKSDEQPVQIMVDRVQPNTSTARVLPSAAGERVKEGYYVYTR